MNMLKLYCFSREDASKFYSSMGWTSDTIPSNVAIISIAGTPECQAFYIGEEENHWFQESSSVLNLNFDDINVDEKIWRGHIFRGLLPPDAERAVKFIRENIGKNIYINCRAGKSRSQAFVRYIQDCYPDIYYTTNPDNPPLTPNIDVLAKLKRAHRECYLDVIYDVERYGLRVINSMEYLNGIIMQTVNKVYYYDAASPYSFENLKVFDNVEDCKIFLYSQKSN